MYVTTITCTPRVYCVFLTMVTAESLGGGKPRKNIRIRADIMYTLKHPSTESKTLSDRFNIVLSRSYRQYYLVVFWNQLDKVWVCGRGVNFMRIDEGVEWKRNCWTTPIHYRRNHNLHQKHFCNIVYYYQWVYSFYYTRLR